jgi:uncharacterized membrane protein
MYAYVLFFHVAVVMSFFGMGVATDAALVHAGRNAGDAPAILRLVLGRNLLVEKITGTLTLLLGIALLFVNPQGMAIFSSGGWIHAKVGAAFVAIAMVLASHAGIRPEGAARWVVPVRGTGLLLALIAVFAAKVMR